MISLHRNHNVERRHKWATCCRASYQPLEMPRKRKWNECTVF